MGVSSTSIAQEYYRLQDYWAEIDADKQWRLAIWVTRFEDVEIVDKFMEVERSALGKFDDIFFRFESLYKGNTEQFEKELYEEWVSWFDEKPDPSLDILKALKNEEMLLFDYQPDRNLQPEAGNLWKEMLRLKSSIKGLEDTGFCVYIPPALTGGHPLTGWFSDVLDRGIPEGIRLTTIDYAEKRKVRLKPSKKVRIITPDLNMREAVSNEMNRGIIAGDAGSVENQYTLQVKKVMETTTKKNEPLLDAEIKKLLSLSSRIDSVSISISSLLIASQTYFMINNKSKCEKYADKALYEAEKAMKAGEPDGYPVWRSALILKAASLAGVKKRREAIELYERLAEEAVNRKDIFYIMEAYRMAGHFYYELGEMNTSLETLLLSLYSGSFLDMETRRQSTFLLSAALALHLAGSIRSDDDVEILENSLQEWLGEDWRNLVETADMKNVKTRRKASIFS